MHILAGDLRVALRQLWGPWQSRQRLGRCGRPGTQPGTVACQGRTVRARGDRKHLNFPWESAVPALHASSQCATTLTTRPQLLRFCCSPPGPPASSPRPQLSPGLAPRPAPCTRAQVLEAGKGEREKAEPPALNSPVRLPREAVPISGSRRE